MTRTNPSEQDVYAANDGMALGSQQAVDNAKRTDVKVIGTDGTEDAMKSVQAGGLAASVAQYPYAIDQMGMEACQAAAQGTKLPDAPRTRAPKNGSWTSGTCAWPSGTSSPSTTARCMPAPVRSPPSSGTTGREGRASSNASWESTGPPAAR